MSSQRLTWGIGHVGPWAAACSVPRVREHLRGASIYGKAAGRAPRGCVWWLWVSRTGHGGAGGSFQARQSCFPH